MGKIPIADLQLVCRATSLLQMDWQVLAQKSEIQALQFCLSGTLNHGFDGTVLRSDRQDQFISPLATMRSDWCLTLRFVLNEVLIVAWGSKYRRVDELEPMFTPVVVSAQLTADSDELTGVSRSTIVCHVPWCLTTSQQLILHIFGERR